MPEHEVHGSCLLEVQEMKLHLLTPRRLIGIRDVCQSFRVLSCKSLSVHSLLKSALLYWDVDESCYAGSLHSSFPLGSGAQQAGLTAATVTDSTVGSHWL